MSTEAIITVAVAVALLLGYLVLRGRKPEEEQTVRTEETRPDDLLRAAFDRAHAAIGFMTADGKWLDINRRFTAILGYTKQDLVVTPMRLMTHPDDRKKEGPLFIDLRSGKRASYTITKRVQKKTGEYRTCRVQMLRCTEGAHSVYQCIIDDVESNGTWMEIVASALSEIHSTAIVSCDAGGNITGWSRGAEELFGYPEVEITGRSWTTLQEPAEQKLAARQLAAAVQGGFMKASATRLRKDGGKIRINSVVIPDSRLGDTNGFLEVCTDAGDDQMVRIAAEELSALQRLKASIETKIASFGAAAAEIERLQEVNNNLQSQLVRKDETEAQLRAGVSMLRTANADLTRKVKILSAAVRKMVMARKDAAAAGIAPAAPSAAAARAPEPEWLKFTGGDIDEIVRRTARLQQSGVLRLKSDRGEKRLVFEEGQIVACTSDSDDRLLGQLLVDAGIIDEEQRRAALEAHRASGTPFGSSIIELGLATQEDLADIMRTKVTKELSDASSWASGDFTFVPNEPISRGMVPVALDVLAMLDELESLEESDTLVRESDPLPVRDDAQPRASAEVEEPVAGSTTTPAFVARSGKKNRTYHRSSCKSAKSIPKKERVTFDSAAQAEAAEYTACPRCIAAVETEL